MKYLNKHGHNEGGRKALEANGYKLGSPPVNLLIQPGPSTNEALVAFSLLAKASTQRVRGSICGAVTPMRVSSNEGVKESSRK